MGQTEASRFVVQEHHTPDGVHWDLMIQTGDALRTWRMAVSPDEISNTPLPLTAIADHPLRFLTYEGPVQHNTGRVSICDHGRAAITKNTPDRITVTLHGRHLHGNSRLTRNGDTPSWTLTVEA